MGTTMRKEKLTRTEHIGIAIGFALVLLVWGSLIWAMVDGMKG